jgi:phosphoglycerate dehydrogenase-like enzyme
MIANNPMFTPEVSQAVKTNGHQLKWIQFTTVGVDTAARSGLPENVPITNVRGVRTGILASHAIALMLGLMRGFHQFERYRAQNHWARNEIGQLTSTTEGKTIVIVGLGEIGRDAARKAKAFDMTVVGVSRAGTAGGYIDEVLPRTRLDEALRRADVLLLALPLDPDTFHLIGAREFELMKATAVVVNIARGPIIDEAALVDALKSKAIAGAALDVTEIEPLPPNSELWRLDNLLFSPHIGGQGDDAQRQRLTALVAENLRRFQAGEELQNLVKQKTSGWDAKVTEAVTM